MFDDAPLRKVDKLGKILGSYQFSKDCNVVLNPNQLHLLTRVLASKLTFEEIAELSKLIKDLED